MATANAEMLPEGGAGSIQGVGEPVPVLVVSEGQVGHHKGRRRPQVHTALRL